jgi:uncharacterized membrane protein YkvA (DUF1232 family)
MNKRQRDPERVGNALVRVFQNSKLVWKLMGDGRVPIGLKLIPIASIFYLLSPIDLIPDPIIGLGQLDDVAVILLALKFFVDLCPKAVVEFHRRGTEAEGPVVDGAYRVVDEP